MKRVQYIGSASLTADTVIGKTWAPGETLLVDSDVVAAALVASSSNFKDTTSTSLTLGVAATANRTLSASDNGKIVPITTVGVTLTLPADMSVDAVDLPVAVSSANLTLQAPAGVTINGGSSANFSPPLYNVMRVRRISATGYVAAI